MTTVANTDEVRDMLARVLAWEDAHVSFESAIDGLPPGLRTHVPPGMPYSVWQLAQHIRLTQRDILEFCVEPEYRERHWPDDYWPDPAVPPADSEWHACAAAVRSDRDALARLVRDSNRSLVAPVPNGDGQTLLREVLLVIDHSAYHIGQIVAVRKAMGEWKK
jgi:uncharacterized damage-inducible protein DinB